MRIDARKFKWLAIAGMILAGGSLHAQTPVGGAGSRPFALLFCTYADKPSTYNVTPASVLNTFWLPNQISYKNAMVDNSISGLVQDASFGSVDFQGTRAFGWFALPKPMSGYAGNMQEINVAADCVRAALANNVDFTGFRYIAVYMNDDLPSSSGFQAGRLTLGVDVPPSIEGFIIVNVRALNGPGLVMHEIGHLLGITTHTNSSSDPTGYVGGGGFPASDLRKVPPDPNDKSCVGLGWDAAQRELFGWIPQSRIATYAGGTQSFQLSRLADPIPGLVVAIDVPLKDGRRYVVSARVRSGYDSRPGLLPIPFYEPVMLAVEGVRIELASPGQAGQLIRSTPGAQPQTDGEIWLAGQTFTDAANRISIAITNFNPTGNPTALITVSDGSKPAAYAINAGGGAAGSFTADANADTGNVYSAAPAVDTTGVTNPAPAAVYQSVRYGNFTYTFPNLTAGANYSVRLHFAEIVWNAPGVRVFHVSVNGNQVLTNFDIFAAAGGMNKATVQQFTAQADPNGQIAIRFVTVADNAQVNGIEIIPQ